jgi:hypothetical protein
MVAPWRQLFVTVGRMDLSQTNVDKRDVFVTFSLLFSLSHNHLKPDLAPFYIHIRLNTFHNMANSVTPASMPSLSPVLRPCVFQGQCVDECLDFIADLADTMRCYACHHLACHHKISDSLSISASDSTPTFSSLSANQTPAPISDRWLSTVQLARSRRLVSEPVVGSSSSPRIPTTLAQQEVRSGFRSASSRLHSTPLAQVNAPGSTSTSGTRGRRRGKRNVSTRTKAPADGFVEIHSLIVVPLAYDFIVEVRNVWLLLFLLKF